MNVLTDFPFTLLPAPLRTAKLLQYDGDKYVIIEVQGELYEVKAGYIYSDAKKKPIGRGTLHSFYKKEIQLKLPI